MTSLMSEETEYLSMPPSQFQPVSSESEENSRIRLLNATDDVLRCQGDDIQQEIGPYVLDYVQCSGDVHQVEGGVVQTSTDVALVLNDVPQTLNLIQKDLDVDLKPPDDDPRTSDGVSLTLTDDSYTQDSVSLAVFDGCLCTQSIVSQTQDDDPYVQSIVSQTQDDDPRVQSIVSRTQDDDPHVQSILSQTQDDDPRVQGGVSQTLNDDNYVQGGVSQVLDDVPSITEGIPQAPDGGWGWMIVLGAFVVTAISDGCAFTFGVLYTELLDSFGESKSKTSLIGSLFVSVPMLCGPFASVLVTKYGCRKMTIVAGVISSAGFVLSSFANSVEVLCVTFGLLAGIGMSVCYVAPIVIVAFYFDQKRALATGLAVCGSGIGTFIFAPLTEYLIEEYGWRGAMLIIGGVILNMVICGALFRPLRSSRAERMNKALKQFLEIPRQDLPHCGRNRSVSEMSVDNEHSVRYNLPGQKGHSQIELPTYTSLLLTTNYPFTTTGSGPGRIERKVSFDQYMKYKTHTPYKILVDNCTKESGCNENLGLHFIGHKKQEEPTDLVLQRIGDQIEFTPTKHVDTKTYNMSLTKTTPTEYQNQCEAYPNELIVQCPTYRRSIFHRGASTAQYNRTMCLYSSCPEIHANPSEDNSDDKNDENCSSYTALRKFNQLKRVMKAMFNVSILQNPFFIVFSASNFILYFWYDVPYVFMADRAKRLGVSEDKASLIISVIGMVNTFGQVFYGYMGDRNVNLFLLYTLSCVMSGLAVMMVPLLTSYWYMCTTGAGYGFFIGSNYALTAVMLVKYLGLDNLTSACGLLNMIQGTANLIGPPVAGWISDVTHSYDAAFYTGGIFILLAGGVLLGMACLKWRKVGRRSQRYESDPCRLF